jgi:predicted metalloenzyme YecM
VLDVDKAESFLENLETLLEEQGIDLTSYFVDHLCYRVSSEKKYLELKDFLSLENELLHEALISNRPISTFKLKEPIKYKGLEIPLLELPSPKPNSHYEEGFEHAEAVIGESFESFSKKYPHIEFDWKGASKTHNPELRINFGKISLKLHHQSLEDVIKEELNS